ncbi:MAG: RagB/SusD family nutrient uptake outer membrane protein [Bacteroidales bacterium]|nr:RagB/SusD family nutrient uptake outer membrane protein [Bacteroidales bacterium]
MKKIIISLSIFALLFCACVPLDTAPYNSETDLTFWQEDPNSAVSALNSCYTSLPDMYEVVYGDGMTDNAYVKGGQNQAIGNGKYGTSDAYVYDVWNHHFAGIRQCNELIQHIDKVPGLEAGLKARYIAEALALRAYHYYELYIHFGGVPFFETPITIAESRTAIRETAAQTSARIEADLKAALEGDALPGSYSGADSGRMTKWAAKALLAKLYLFDAKWSDVRDVTAEIMSDSGIQLFPSYAGLFEVANETCSEIMFSNQYMPVNREHNIMYNTVPPSMGGYSNLAPLKSLVDSYIMLNGKAIGETGSGYDANNPWIGRDPRLAATVMYPGNSYTMSDGTVVEPDWNGRDMFNSTSDVTPTGYYIRKWWDNTYRLTLMSGLNAIIIRYADVLLMNAEAHAELGTLNDAVWNATIRKIRERAGFTDAGALNLPNGGNLKEIVRNERRCELAFEGQRRTDIIRWKTAEQVLNGWCHGMYTGETVGTDNGFVRIEQRQFDASKHYLWPIPQKERDLTNNSLEQNPNW